MLTNVLRAISPAHPANPGTELEIGSVGAGIFSCPQCARPLGSENMRCPGCGTRLVLGVPSQRAAVFATLGLAAGLLVGALVAGLALSGSRPAVVRTATQASSVTNPQTTSGSSGSTSSGTTTIVPSASIAALQQSAVINGRLATGIAALQAELAAKPFDANAVATTLRDLAADATVGADSTARISDWSAAAQLSAQLSSFYDAVRSTAREGLDNSVWNEAAYKAAGTKMVQALSGLTQLNDQTQQLASQASVSVPTYTGR